MKIQTLCTVFILKLFFLVSANSFSRTTVTFDLYYMIGGKAHYTIEGVHSFRPVKNLTFLMKFFQDKRVNYNATMVSGGFVAVLFKYGYIENTYGLKIDNNKNISHIINADFYFEKDNYLISGTHRITIDDRTVTNLFSFSTKIFVIPQISIFFKQYLGYEPYDRITTTLWSEAEFNFCKYFKIKSGFTIGYFYYSFENDFPIGPEYSLTAGFSFTYKWFKVQHIFEFSDRTLLYRTIKNSLSIDISI